MVRACGRGVAGCVEITFLDVTPARWRASDSLVDFHTQEGATRCLPPEDDDENLQTRCVSFRTLPDVPEPPRPPKVRASRFRGAADLANLIAPYGTEKDSLAAMGAAVRPPHPSQNTVAVKVRGYRVGTAPRQRRPHQGVLLMSFLCGAREGVHFSRRITVLAPIAEANWTHRARS